MKQLRSHLEILTSVEVMNEHLDIARLPYPPTERD
jgi:hypothetical protein